MDLRDERDLAYQRLLKICQAGFLSINDFRSDRMLPLQLCKHMADNVVPWFFCYEESTCKDCFTFGQSW